MHLYNSRSKRTRVHGMHQHEFVAATDFMLVRPGRLHRSSKVTGHSRGYGERKSSKINPYIAVRGRVLNSFLSVYLLVDAACRRSVS